MKLVFSSRFEEDFAELVFYFASQRGEALAARFENAVCDLVELLLQNPEIGRSRIDLKPAGIRSLLVPEFRNYLLFYQIKRDEIILLRLRHGGMDLPELFSE